MAALQRCTGSASRTLGQLLTEKPGPVRRNSMHRARLVPYGYFFRWSTSCEAMPL